MIDKSHRLIIELTFILVFIMTYIMIYEKANAEIKSGWNHSRMVYCDNNLGNSFILKNVEYRPKPGGGFQIRIINAQDTWLIETNNSTTCLFRNN